MWEFFIYVYAKYASYQAYCFRPVFRIFLDVREPMSNNNEEDDDQLNSVAQSWLTLCAPMDCSTPGLPVHYQLPEFTQTHVHWVGDAIQPSHPLSSPSPPPSIFPSIRVFSNESVLRIRCPKYWSFSFSISPSNEYSGLISFRIEWFDLCAVQGNLKSPLQHHSSKASVLQYFLSSAFLQSNSHIHIKPQLWLDGPLLAK